MDILGWSLLAWLIVTMAALVAIEVLAIVWRKPTISDRVRRLGGAAPIVIILVSFMTGYLLAHFWD